MMLRKTNVFLSHLHQTGNPYSVLHIKNHPFCFWFCSSSSSSSSIASTTNEFKKPAKGYVFHNINDALTLFNQMARASPRPSIVEFSKLLGAIVGMKNYAIVISLCKQMELLGITHDAYTLNILINCFCHSRRVDFAFSVLGKMLKLGYNPHLVTFSALIKGFCMERKIAQAARLFNEMVLTGHQPNLYIYTIIVNGLCKIGDSNGALRMLRDMEVRGFLPDIVAYSAVVDSLCKNKFITEALDLVDRKSVV